MITTASAQLSSHVVPLAGPLGHTCSGSSRKYADLSPLSPFMLPLPQHPPPFFFNRVCSSHLSWKIQVPEMPTVQLPCSVAAIVQAGGSALGWEHLPLSTSWNVPFLQESPLLFWAVVSSSLRSPACWNLQVFSQNPLSLHPERSLLLALCPHEDPEALRK